MADPPAEIGSNQLIVITADDGDDVSIGNSPQVMARPELTSGRRSIAIDLNVEIRDEVLSRIERIQSASDRSLDFGVSLLPTTQASVIDGGVRREA